MEAAAPSGPSESRPVEGLVGLREEQRALRHAGEPLLEEDALASAIEDLVTVLRSREAVVTGEDFRHELDLSVGFLDRSELTALFPRLVSGDERSDAERKRHLLWTFEDVLERYGRPDDVGTQNLGHGRTWEWCYDLVEPNRVCFEFSEGLVIDVTW